MGSELWSLHQASWLMSHFIFVFKCADLYKDIDNYNK